MEQLELFWTLTLTAGCSGPGDQLRRVTCESKGDGESEDVSIASASSGLTLLESRHESAVRVHSQWVCVRWSWIRFNSPENFSLQTDSPEGSTLRRTWKSCFNLWSRDCFSITSFTERKIHWCSLYENICQWTYYRWDGPTVATVASRWRNFPVAQTTCRWKFQVLACERKKKRFPLEVELKQNFRRVRWSK